MLHLDQPPLSAVVSSRWLTVGSPARLVCAAGWWWLAGLECEQDGLLGRGELSEGWRFAVVLPGVECLGPEFAAIWMPHRWA